MRERQSAKIWELKVALMAAGIFSLDEQAEVLGLSRSTAWAVLNGHNKTGGLSALTINRILAAPRLPALVRAKILEFVEEKAAGLYGHSKSIQRKFIAERTTLVRHLIVRGVNDATDQPGESETGFKARRDTRSVDSRWI
jgi:hypothetical protein